MIKIPYYETSYFSFSNFSSHSIKIDGVLYPTVEHAFHAAKFDNEKIKEEIKSAGSPLKAFEIGKKYKPQRRSNWDETKVSVLQKIIAEKVKQHDEVRKALLATGNEEIIEDNPLDDFWGNGKDGNGQNHMGKILMRIRNELQFQ
ncbi:MAG: NADAR family protein [Candidatus Levybacteria bacterium]|nr:NADAR family protein [Candidatus Levybacteria bacterium]